MCSKEGDSAVLVRKLGFVVEEVEERKKRLLHAGRGKDFECVEEKQEVLIVCVWCWENLRDFFLTEKKNRKT